MAWTNLTFPFASLLTSTQMTQMDDNFDALAAGLAGAPPILEAAYGAGSVDQTALKTSTASQAGTIPASGVVEITMSAYSFFPMIHNTTGSVHMIGHSADGVSADAPRFAFRESGDVIKTFDVDNRFITA